MRLGEIKKTIGNVLSENNLLLIDQEVIFNGQANSVKNYAELIAALDILADQSWNDLDYAPIELIKNEHKPDDQVVQLLQGQFNQLNTYISSLNQKVPLYFSILETMAEDQEEQAINLKLPNEAIALKDLIELNKRLEKLFKEFTIDGEFKFIGFDKGTSWYIMWITGELSYRFFTACLKLSQEYFKTKKVYFESEKAKLDYKASLNDAKSFSAEGLTKYVDRRLNLNIEKGINEAIEKIDGRNGQTKEELFSRLVIATKGLVKELGEGTEFHLSLNPPSFVSEENGNLTIDYVKIQQIRDEERKKTSQIQGVKQPAIKKKEVDDSEKK